MNKNNQLRCVLALAMVAHGVTGAIAQDAAYPVKPVRLLVPYPPGASNDILARALAQRLSARFAQNVVVDNRPGAGGHIGAELVARAPADGYTLLLGTSGLISISPSVYRNI